MGVLLCCDSASFTAIYGFDYVREETVNSAAQASARHYPVVSECSIQSAISRNPANDSSLCTLCDNDAETVEDIWKANKGGINRCSFCNGTVDSRLGRSEGPVFQLDGEPDDQCVGLPSTACGCCDSYTFKLKQNVDRLSDCDAHWQAMHETVAKVSYEQHCLPCDEAMNLAQCLLLGLWHMNMCDDTKPVLIQFGAPVIFVGWFWKILDVCTTDTTNCQANVSIKFKFCSEYDTYDLLK
jgi:hypothetical protein